MKSFDPKRPGEAVTLAFDFAPLLPEGVTITSADPVTVGVWAGEDADPAAIIVGSPVLYSAIVLQRVQGGLLDVDYLPTARVILSDGQIREFPVRLPVRLLV